MRRVISCVCMPVFIAARNMIVIVTVAVSAQKTTDSGVAWVVCLAVFYSFLSVLYRS